MLDLNQSVFCWGKGGRNQGYRHFGTTLFKADNFFLIKESMSALCLHIGTQNQGLPTSQSLIQSRKFPAALLGKRKLTTYYGPWIDLFNPRLIQM